MPAPEDDGLESMNVTELKTLARDLGITGYSSMNKQDLIDAIRSTYPEV